MKKTISYIAILAMLLTIFAVPVYAAPKQPPNKSLRVVDTCQTGGSAATHFAAELMAGQDIDVGEVRIDATGVLNQYRVTYIVDEPGWFLTEVHFEAISATDEKYIYSNGGLIPGAFTCKKSWDISEGLTTYTCLYTAGAPVTGFAAHAVVAKNECITIVEAGTGDVISNTSTAVTVSNTGNPVPYPAVPSSPTPKYDANTWINETGSNGWAVPPPIWIWEYDTEIHPREGDIVTFEKTFNIPGNPNDCVLNIAADNGYAVWVNGNFVGSDNLLEGVGLTDIDTEAEFRAALTALTQNYVDTTTWQTPGMFTIPAALLNTGTNTLKILAVNEYCWSDDGNNPDATTENGLNPGGLVFCMNLCWDAITECNTYEETAWGFGNEVNGGNWSQTITNSTHHQLCTVGLENGSFEDPALTSSWGIFNTVPGWTVAWMGVHNDLYNIPNIEYQNIITADDGTQYAELDSYGPISISQDIDTCIHHNYVISFAWSPRAGAECAMDVLWNGDIIGTYSGNTAVWNTVTISGLVPDADGESTLVFRETGAFDQLGMFLDDVTINFD